MASHSSILAWGIPWQRILVGYSPWGHKESDTTEQFPHSLLSKISFGLPGCSAGKESACNEEDLGLIPGLRRSPGEGKSYPTPVFWPGEFHGLYSPWGGKESAERLSLSLLLRCSLDGEVFLNEKCNLLFLSPTNLLPIPCLPLQNSAFIFNPPLSLSYNSLLLRCVLYIS